MAEAYVDPNVMDDSTGSGGRRRGKLRIAAPSVTEVALAALGAGLEVRMGPVDSDHVLALAEVPDRWPPIVVRAETMTVLDGAHRVAAAQHLGATTIQALLLECGDDEALIEAVRRNVEHGLPLSLKERRGAARRLLEMAPARSDRAIASICALDHKTVGRLRREDRRSDGRTAQPPVRIGRDDRARPVDVSTLRDRIAAALRNSPGASLRTIARQVEASPETVRDVRARLARGDGPGPDRLPAAPLTRPEAKVLPREVVEWPHWMADSACRSSHDAAEFAAWLDDGRLSLEWRRFVTTVPLSRVYEVSDQARAYAAAWRDFADAIERRSRPGVVAANPEGLEAKSRARVIPLHS
jgi:ParB-like nuclease domain